MSNFIRSAIRTYVPIIVGAVIGWLASLGIEVDEAAINGLTAFLSGLGAALYWTLVRIVERRFPRFGALLGAPGEPVYPSVTSTKE